MKDQNKEFLNLYGKISNRILSLYKIDVKDFNCVDYGFSSYKTLLENARSIRNVLSHPVYLSDSSDPILVNENFLIALKDFYEELSSNDIYKYCTKLTDIVRASSSDKVLDFVNVMQDKSYNQIPVLENGIVIGSLGEETLNSYLLDISNAKDLPIIDDCLTFNDIKDYIKLENHRTEEFKFVSRNCSYVDCKKMFIDSYNSKKKRLGMIFITEHGDPKEKLIGLITAWGVLGKNFYF